MERRNITKGCSWSYFEALMPAFDWIAFLAEYRGGNVGFRVVKAFYPYVLRGGSYGYEAFHIRSTNLFNDEGWSKDTGFRVVER